MTMKRSRSNMTHAVEAYSASQFDEECPPQQRKKPTSDPKSAPDISGRFKGWPKVSLQDPAVFESYRKCQRAYFDFPSIIPLLVVAVGSTITRLCYAIIGNASPAFIAGLCFFLFDSLLFVTYTFSRLIVKLTPEGLQQRRYFQICDSWLFFCHKWRIEDIIIITTTASGGLNLIARVFNGQCEDLNNIWTSLQCNPTADLGFLPLDQVCLLYLIPLMCQSVFRVVTAEALTFSWVLILMFVLTSSIQVGGLLQVWMIFYSVIFINISVIMERVMRLSFVQRQEMLDLAHLRGKYELQLLEFSAENERKHKEKEIFQLRSLMGNVAHDLKTPLHSIEADLAVLGSICSNVLPEAFIVASEKFECQGQCDAHNFDPKSILDSLIATCKFMGMAINRSEDFMKASNNIALVPVIETFDPIAAVQVSVTCMNHLQSGRTIVVHPSESNISRRTVSDKRWLTENVLCLLSNAVKYSGSGTIDVKIEVSDCPFYPGKSFSNSYSARGGKSEVEDTLNCSADSQPRFKPVEPGPSIVVSVEDTGVGVANEARKTLFEPFNQSQRRAGGTGIGLYSLTKRIEALGGTNGVSSRSDGQQGSVFWFSIPYRPEEAMIPPKPSKAEIDTVAVGPVVVSKIASRNILVVDDSLSVLKVTSRLLSINGHTVTTAPNGSAGLLTLIEAYDEECYDMVLTDLQMPVMDGIEATRRYREFESEQLNRPRKDGFDSRKRKRLLIVGMSATTDIQCMQEGLNAGMDYFVSKPFSYDDIQPILVDDTR
jgi:signal transduction histidine kinase/CheY-like chemotaxis protein